MFPITMQCDNKLEKDIFLVWLGFSTVGGAI